MGVGIEVGVGVGMVRMQGGDGAPPAETVVRTYVVETTIIGEGVSCTAAVGDLIVVYASARSDKCYALPEFRPTWNGLSFTVVQQSFGDADVEDPGGDPLNLIAIGTLLVPTGKAGTYDLSWDFHDCPADYQSVYIEKWTGVTSGSVNREATSYGYSSTPASGQQAPTVNHALVLGAIGRDGGPASEGTWGAGLTGAGHMHNLAHLSTAYEIQTTATVRGAIKSGVTLGYWGAVTVMMSAQ